MRGTDVNDVDPVPKPQSKRKNSKSDGDEEVSPVKKRKIQEGLEDAEDEDDKDEDMNSEEGIFFFVQKKRSFVTTGLYNNGKTWKRRRLFS